jgi:cytoskeletal protein CcmA (bactofilin family)
MSVFKNLQKDKIMGNDAETTILTKDTKINGQVETSSNLHLDGNFEGNIVSTGVIVVGNSGTVKSDVKAETILVSGKIEGTVIAKVVEIKPKGSIVGNVTSEEFVIERNGTFEGVSHHKEFKVDSMEEPPPEEIEQTS